MYPSSGVISKNNLKKINNIKLEWQLINVKKNKNGIKIKDTLNCKALLNTQSILI